MSISPTFALLLLAVALPAQAARYRVVPIPTLGGPSSRVFHSNSFGEVAGYSRNGVGQELPIVWRPAPRAGLPAGLQDLGLPPGATWCRARSLNDRGEVLGHADDAAGNTGLVLWLPAARLGYSTGWNLLGGLGGGFARARYSTLHDDLTFVGEGTVTPGGPLQALLHLAVPKWGMQSGIHDLSSADPSVTWARLRDISSGGTAVGDGEPAGGPAFTSAIWMPTTGWSFPDQRVRFSGRASAISDGGFIAGSRGPTGGLWDGYLGLGPLQLFLPRLFPSPGDVWVQDVNDLGQVVGYSRTTAFGGGTLRATTWDRTVTGAVPVDLHTTVSGLGAWSLERPYSISNSGMIAGYGQLAGEERGFLLVPRACDLGVQPSLPSPGALVKFDIYGGAVRRPAAIVAVDLNGMPVREVLALGVLDGLGSATIPLGFPLPPGLGGNVLQVKAVTYDALGQNLIESPPRPIRFQ